MTQKHIPVLAKEVLDLLDPKKGETYLDLTAGYGGHAHLVLERTQAPGKVVLVDRDKTSIEHLQQTLGNQVRIMHSDFLSSSRQLESEQQKFDLILADLGVSSEHLDQASRGFSFLSEGPLDMRMDQNAQLSAETVVNTYSEKELTKILLENGEEAKAARIAKEIVRARPISTTKELADIVKKAVRLGKHKKVHPATKSFQALRIAVNDELRQLEQALPIWFNLLSPGGRIAIISFHSLEDRIVKQALKDIAGDRYDASLRLLTKKPITAQHSEIVFNPRARSAKLRAAVK